MEFPVLWKMQVNRLTDAVLAMPANQAKGRSGLEMAFVLDESSDPGYVRDAAAEVVRTLKAHDRKFQNVRCNAVFWGKDGRLVTEVMPMAFMQLGRIWEANRRHRPEMDPGEKTLENLTGYLKFYHARSKCIFLITDQEAEEGCHEKLIENVNPFLKSKILLVKPDGISKWKLLF